MTRVRFFAQARDATGCREAEIEGSTVKNVLEAAAGRFGPAFAEVLSVSRIWVNGAEADPAQTVGDCDEVAVLPPVSGG